MKDLNELLTRAVGWEDRLTGYFTQLGAAVTDPSCCEMLDLIKSNHFESVAILHDIRAVEFGADEWLSCDPDDVDPAALLVPATDLSGHPPCEVLRQLLAFEECIQAFYLCIADRIVQRNERELFEALAHTKKRLIHVIRSCLEYKQGH